MIDVYGTISDELDKQRIHVAVGFVSVDVLREFWAGAYPGIIVTADEVIDIVPAIVPPEWWLVIVERFMLIFDGVDGDGFCVLFYKWNHWNSPPLFLDIINPLSHPKNFLSFSAFLMNVFSMDHRPNRKI